MAGKKDKLIAIGTIVRFHDHSFGRVNPHDGHLCKVVEGRIKIANSGRIRHCYILADLNNSLPVRAKRIFKMTDDTAFKTFIYPDKEKP